MPTLNEECIRNYLGHTPLNERVVFHLHTSLDSTQQFLKNHALDNRDDLHICCAETQTQGRGRLGRSWHSPMGENIYCSIRWSVKKKNIAALSTLSLVVSLALTKVLHECGIQRDLRIKWPNDVLWCGKKLSGILIELMQTSSEHIIFILGIGLNVHSMQLNEAWCSMKQILQKDFDRNHILARLLVHLEHHITAWEHHGFTHFKTDWEKFDYLYQHAVSVSRNDGVLSGIADGINEEGLLRLIDEQNKLHLITSGETFLKF